MANVSWVTEIMERLGKKRWEAMVAIATYAVGSGTAVTVPTPWIELPKHVVLAASDILLYVTIWRIYFEEDLSHDDVLGLLAEVGLVTLASAGTAYLITRGSTAIVNEITDWLGPTGWGLGAAVSGSLTAVVGVLWAIVCDRLWQSRYAPTALIADS